MTTGHRTRSKTDPHAYLESFVSINDSDQHKAGWRILVTKAMALLSTLGGGVRTAWLVLGVSLALLAVLELFYRAQGGIRHRVAEASSPDVSDPRERLSWSADYERESEISTPLRWKPYVYFRRRPFTGRYINIDSSGIRRTIQPEPNIGLTVDTVFMFGGSTMWGNAQRDSGTIPSIVAARLAEHDIRHARVVNLGEMGYVFTQEAIELLLRLRDGARPRAVVFYDGINDVTALVQSGVAGIPQNESHRARDFRVGREIFAWKTDLSAELRAAASIGGALAFRSQLVQRLLSAAGSSAWAPRPHDELAAGLLNTYVNTVLLVEAMADDYGFEVIYIWQPSLHTTQKPLTPFEQHLMGTLDTEPFHATSKTIHTILAQSIDSAMTGVAPGRFLNLWQLFAADTAGVFVDNIGHTTEEANTAVVGAILTVLLPMLRDGSP